MNWRENWRILMLVVFIVLSGVALFAPTGGAGGGDANVTTGDGITNLRYGLDLSGGLRIRGHLAGMTAEDLSITPDEAGSVQETVYQELGLQPVEVNVRAGQDGAATVEVFEANLTESTFRDALSAAGVDASAATIREGVTADTRSNAADVLSQKINRGGIGGGGASVVNTATGRSFIVVETPSTNLSKVMETVTSTGRVQVVALHPTDGNVSDPKRTPLLTQGDFQRISQATNPRGGSTGVTVTLTQDAADNFSAAMQTFGFTGPGEQNCIRNDPDTPADDTGWCIQTVVDGEVTFSADMSSGLAQSIEGGSFLDNRIIRITTGGSLSQAQQVKIDLETGALPTGLQVSSVNKVLPSLAQRFKPLALLTGLIAWGAVAGVVFLRYRELKVAIPMLLTAVAEVFILLGFAASVGLALDLSHIAGFIAVIGTGVDDLVIIADEILQRGDIATGRVFQSRFRKAFWVIGAAAATTIIAMSPLTVLALGDLSGFAIVTIVGVLIGVLITRPAYGDILRNLLLEEE